MYQGFEDRREAGILLARKLSSYAGRTDTIVVALPRGGVPVAYEVATALNLPLDVFVVRKLGAPGHEEFAMGAIAPGGVCLVDQESARTLHVTNTELEVIVERERFELERRERLYRGARPPFDVRGKTVIIVDDGLATGLSMRAAVASIKKLGPKKIVVAVPVCAPVTCEELQKTVDVWCVCVRAPETFYAVGLWYKDFRQTSDQEVQSLLALADSGQVSARHYV
jgi:predicted phosphoribosyltransferase